MMERIRWWLYATFGWLCAVWERWTDAYYRWKFAGLTYGDILWMWESGGLLRDPVQAGYVPKEVISEKWLKRQSMWWLHDNGFCICCGFVQFTAKGWCDFCHEDLGGKSNHK